MPWRCAARSPGRPNTAIPARPAALIDLVTPGAATEYRLGYGNFYVITRSNRSSFYAMSVFQLGEAQAPDGSRVIPVWKD